MADAKRTKDQLAELLGLPASAIIDRDGVAELVGKAKGTIENWGAKGPRYWRSTDGKTGGTVWYIRAEVEAFITGNIVPLGPRPWGKLSTPTEIAEAFLRRELRRRAMAYRAGANGEITIEQFIKGRRIPADLLRSSGHHEGTPELVAALTSIAMELSDQDDPHPHVAKFIWQELMKITDLEERWLRGDRSTLKAALAGYEPPLPPFDPRLWDH